MAVLKNIVSKIFNLNTTPAKKTEGQFWYDTTNNVLKRSDGSDYKPLAVGDNLISAGSADTVKGILNSKANASELSNYLKKTGDNSLELGTQYETEGTILLNSEYADVSTYCTEITGNNGISIYSDVGAIWLDASGTGIVFGSTHNPNDTDNIMFSVRYNGIIGTFVDTSLETELEDWKYDQHIATSKAIKSYVDKSVLNKANASDLSNYLPTSGGTISSNAHSALTIDVTGQGGANVNGGLTVNSSYADWSTPDGDRRTDTTHYGASSITGDAVTSSITSGSNKLLTSGAVYQALNDLSLTIDAKADKSDLNDYLPLYLNGSNGNNGTGSTITREIHGQSSQPVLTIIDDTGNSFSRNPGSILKLTEKYLSPLDNIIEHNTLFFADHIEGDAVTSSITSGSNKLLTSGGAYTALQSKADNTNVVHLSGDEVITGNKTFTSSIRFSSGDTFNTNLAGVSVPDPEVNLGTPPVLTIDSNSNITIDASNAISPSLYYSYGIISGVNWNGETFRIDGKDGSASFSCLNVSSWISGSAVVSTLGTSTTSIKLPTEGAVVKAISDVKTSLGSALTYEGSVENYSNLPTGLTTSDKGKVYNVVNANGDIPAGTNYAWNGTSWDALGGDLSAYQLKTDQSLTTTSKQIVGAINELNLKIDITTGPAPITSVYTVDSTVLEAFITDTQYANIQGRITISPSIDNIGAVYFGQSITDKSQAFPLYPGQIMSFTFTDINTFMCASDIAGDKFNYVVEFGVVNKDSIMDAGMIIRSATGENYRLIPVTDETGAATLELERLV